MRNGFNGVDAKIQTMQKYDPVSSHVFILRERSGAMLNGSDPLVTVWACGQNASREAASPVWLAMMPESIDWQQPKRLLTLHT